MPRYAARLKSTAGSMTSFVLPNKGIVAVCILLILLPCVVFGYDVLQTIEDRASEVGAPVKVGFSPDWEYGSRKKLAHKLTNRAPEELEKVVTYMNDVYQPDIVVGGGDYIESSAVKPETAKRQLREINAIFSRLTAPRLYALGNHDMRSLAKDEVLSILGLSEAHTLRDIGQWRLVVIDTNFNKSDDSHRNAKAYTVGYVSRQELEWLEQAVTTDRPTIVFSHHSPVSTYNIDNVLTENITNAYELRSVLERHSNVVAVVSGHTPRPQFHEYAGISYFVGDTLVNEFGLGAFATLDLLYNPFSTRTDIRFEHYGNNRQSYHAVSFIEREERTRFFRMIKKVLKEMEE